MWFVVFIITSMMWLSAVTAGYVLGGFIHILAAIAIITLLSAAFGRRHVRR